MPKFKIEFEDSEIKRTLTFRGKEFVVVMGDWEDGKRTSKEKCLEYQVRETFSDDEDIDDITEHVDVLDFETDEEGIERALEELSWYED